ncbi:hypothetical protein Hanom_Chr08g00730321 [Helianthus anomalus]
MNLVNRKCENFNIAIILDMETCEGLVISDPERGKGFIKVQVKPVNTNIQVASKYK